MNSDYNHHESLRYTYNNIYIKLFNRLPISFVFRYDIQTNLYDFSCVIIDNPFSWHLFKNTPV